MNWFQQLYIIMGAIIIVLSAVGAGFVDDNNPIDVIGSGCILAVGWPIILALAIVASPLAGLYYFGKLLGKLRTQ